MESSPSSQGRRWSHNISCANEGPLLASAGAGTVATYGDYCFSRKLRWKPAILYAVLSWIYHPTHWHVISPSNTFDLIGASSSPCEPVAYLSRYAVSFDVPTPQPFVPNAMRFFLQRRWHCPSLSTWMCSSIPIPGSWFTLSSICPPSCSHQVWRQAEWHKQFKLTSLTSG